MRMQMLSPLYKDSRGKLIPGWERRATWVISREIITFNAKDRINIERVSRELSQSADSSLKDAMSSTVRASRRASRKINVLFTLRRIDTPSEVYASYLLVDAQLTKAGYFMTAGVWRHLRATFKSALREYRARTHRIPVTEKNVLGHTIRKHGDVYLTPGLFLQAYGITKTTRIFRDKSPRTAERHVGIELEFVCPHPRETLIEKIYKAKLQAYVTLKSDGSIRTNLCECTGTTLCQHKYGHELCVIVPESEYPTVIRQVGEFFEDAKASVNSSCGFHVHLDMRDRRPMKAYRNLVLCQGLLYGMQPESRRTNQFCVPVRSTQLTRLIRSGNAGRYVGVNGTALRKHKTIEVRIHTGTCNPDKIINWVSLLIRIVNAVKLASPVNTPQDIPAELKISKELSAYIKMRTDRFDKIDVAHFQYAS